ncbi:MAG: SDR family oxidoreductase [SAR324 cluster bacterium]|jgi:NAD(P)-dependent dehydrogenase (short-subunit alcohol dehydrogenase family)|nr:SDR family oxidoreductase [SAR324 cluster bacterium]
MGGFANYPSLEDRTVFITGGASGIGESLVEAFVRQKSRVAFIDLDFDASQALQKRLEDEGLQKPWFKPCDVRDIASLEKCLRNAALDLGPVSVLVNNAGNDERHKADEISVEYWDDRIAVNLRHQFFAAREVARDMKENGGGSIINFGSVQAYLSSPGMSGYAVSKYGVRGVTRTLAREFGKNNIRVNTVVPGWVMTERQKELWVDEAAEKMIDEVQCLPGRLQPSDVARLVLFLASDDSAMCTAQDFIVDAGWV